MFDLNVTASIPGFPESSSFPLFRITQMPQMTSHCILIMFTIVHCSALAIKKLISIIFLGEPYVRRIKIVQMSVNGFCLSNNNHSDFWNSISTLTLCILTSREIEAIPRAFKTNKNLK